jgi:hypothetical protein
MYRCDLSFQADASFRKQPLIARRRDADICGITMRTPESFVIGDGIAGLCAALYARRRGYEGEIHAPPVRG